MSAYSFIDLVRVRAADHPSRLACIYLHNGEDEAARLTFGEIDAGARAVAASLQHWAPGETGQQRALLLYPPGLEFLTAFFGCLYAGVVAVPCQPPGPARAGREQPHSARLRSILADASPSFLLTTAALAGRAQGPTAGLAALAPPRLLVTDEALPAGADDWRETAPPGESLAFLQYTSGSTSDPKGVMVTHGNLLHNQEIIRTACEHDEESGFVSWLPIYHDMGLIGALLQPLYLGSWCVLMSPVAFLQRPVRWLRAISRYRAHTSGGPDFAYSLCVQKISAEQRAELDLTSWKVAFNGAEPVRAATLNAFAEAFAPFGFRRTAFFPCYGLAEATLIVSGEVKSAAPCIRPFRESGSQGAAEALSLVGCGPVWGGQEVAIVDPETLAEREDGEVGEVWVSGPSVAAGYWNRPDATESTFRARLARAGEQRFLRTGDLGFLADGQLFVTGRLKDLLIVRGQNHYPQDLELTAQESHPAVRDGMGAAFSVQAEGGEGVVLVQEAHPRRPHDWSAALEAVRQAVSEEHGIALHAVLLVKPGAVPRTTSGKVQRQLCRRRFLEGGLEPLASWRPAAAAAEPAPRAVPFARTVPEFSAWLQGLVARRLGRAAEEVDAAAPLLRHGLDSLASVELLHEIESELGVELPLALLLEGPSLDRLAADLHGRLGQEAVCAPIPPGPDGEEGEHPLSPGQRALWFLQQLDPDDPAYHIVAAVRLDGAIDSGALHRAFRALAGRHGALRTTFSLRQGEPVQRVHADADPGFAEVDAAGWTGEELETRLVAEAFRPFDLERGPLLRLHLFLGASRGAGASARGPSPRRRLLVARRAAARARPTVRGGA